MRCNLRAALPLLAAFSLLATGIETTYAIDPYDARNGDECRAQVNANYAAMEDRMRAQGNYAGISVVEDHMRGPDLLSCKGLDNILQNDQMSAASHRLSSATDSLRGGHLLSNSLIQGLGADNAAIIKMPPSPYREYYLHQYTDYQRYLSAMPSGAGAVEDAGSSKPPRAQTPASAIYRCVNQSKNVSYSDKPCPPNRQQQALLKSTIPRRLTGESCRTLRKHVAESHHAYDAAIKALLASAQQTGEGWRISEDQSTQAVSDLRWYTDRAHLLRCDTP